MLRPRFRRAGAVLSSVLVIASCAHASIGTEAAAPRRTTAARSVSPSTTHSRSSAHASTSSAVRPSDRPRHSTTAGPSTASPLVRTSTVRRASTGTSPLVVLDPGHSVATIKIDPRTGLNVSDYENEPEMRDVWDVAVMVEKQLRAAGYRVAMTKTSLRQPADLAARAYLAKRLHASLALSIHDQAGANGGIPFTSGNNIVYYQTVGTYRATASGRKVYFTDKGVAARSRRYGSIFRTQRQAYERHYVSVRGNVGYNLGSRGLAAGNIWMVQLLSDVPWIYNEAGGNSAGRIGLSEHDKSLYAKGLVASVERCLPVRGR